VRGLDPVRRFTLLASLVMLAASAVAYFLRDARVAAGAGAGCLGALALLHAGRFTPQGRFGLANGITALRAGLVLVLASLRSVGPFAAALLAVFLVLDAVDGWVARRLEPTASQFGARFDMETDALLVLVFGLKLAEVGRLGAWIVVPGLLRYLYAVFVSVVPAAREAPRSSFARVVAGLMMTSLAVSAWPVEVVFRPLAVLSAGLVVVSFACSALPSSST
jgi:phosphatidylglycerophosphate synthase